MINITTTEDGMYHLFIDGDELYSSSRRDVILALRYKLTIIQSSCKWQGQCYGICDCPSAEQLVDAIRETEAYFHINEKGVPA